MMKPKKPIGPDGRVRPAQAPAGSGVSVREATDKMLVEELRCRGWFVVCTKTQRL